MKNTKKLTGFLLTLIAVFLAFTSTKSITEYEFKKENLEVHFINIGQGDSSLIKYMDKTVLIDGGPKSSSEILENYLIENKIEKIDYLFASHPHEDHIGGLVNVINKFDIGEIYAAKIPHTTNTYLDFLKAIDNKNIKINSYNINDDFYIEDLKFVFLSNSLSDTDDLNDSSTVLKVEKNEHSFLFTGDISQEVEKELLINSKDIDVLKVAHHGSRYSSSIEFLEKVKPRYAVISAAEENSYGHPHKEVIERLNAVNAKILETFKYKSIIFLLDNEKSELECIEVFDN